MKLIVMATWARYCGAMIVIMIIVTGAVGAELRPDAESLALPGVEVIDIDVRKPARLTLNAVNTMFASVTVDDNVERAGVALDAVVLATGNMPVVREGTIEARN